MKKFLLIGGGILLVGAVVFSFVFFSKKSGHSDSLSTVNGGGVLKLQNAENSDIKIIVADTNQISINLGGVQEEEAKKVRFFKSGKGVTELDLTHKWWGNDAVITVPKGTLIDVSLGENKPIVLEDPIAGDKESDGSADFLIDTNAVNEITFDADAVSVEGDGTDEVVVWDTENWDYFDFEDDTTEGGGQDEDGDGDTDNDDYLPPVCSVGSQAIRNYCCEMLNEGEDAPYCAGYGHWIFNNVLRLCDYTCETDDAGDDSENSDDFFINIDDPADCLDGSPIMQNECCADQNEGVDTPECIGEWRFNATEISCDYHCFTPEELEDYYSGNTGGGDESTEYCSSLPTTTERDECCEYHFGNELSTGPDPGLPDCIGRWYFDSTTDSCNFHCADHAEMMEILQEIKNRQ